MGQESASPEINVTIANTSSSEENDDGLASDILETPVEPSSIVIVEDSEHSDDAATAHSSATPSETGESDAVAIAGIESERDIAVASIAAEVELARIEGPSETLIEEITETKSELEICQEEIRALRLRVEQMEASSSIPQPQLETLAEAVVEELTEQAELETATEPSSTPQSTATPILETPTEVLAENVDDVPAVVEADLKPRRKFIVI